MICSQILLINLFSQAIYFYDFREEEYFAKKIARALLKSSPAVTLYVANNSSCRILFGYCNVLRINWMCLKTFRIALVE